MLSHKPSKLEPLIKFINNKYFSTIMSTVHLHFLIDKHSNWLFRDDWFWIVLIRFSRLVSVIACAMFRTVYLINIVNSISLQLCLNRSFTAQEQVLEHLITTRPPTKCIPSKLTSIKYDYLSGGWIRQLIQVYYGHIVNSLCNKQTQITNFA